MENQWTVEEGMGGAFVSRLVAQRGMELGKIKEVRIAGLTFLNFDKNVHNDLVDVFVSTQNVL